MGLFLAMSGVIGAAPDETESALRQYAASKGGQLIKERLSSEDDDCLVIGQGPGGVTVVYPNWFLDWDDASAHVSKVVGKPTFSFHIHDGDLWMYVIYEAGQAVDQFNPLADYWGDVEPDEHRRWSGDAAKLAKVVPGLSIESVSNYLIEWRDEILDGTEKRKAYADDEYGYGDDWQLIDFIRRLGLTFPIDDRGAALAPTYRFTCAGL